METAINEQKLTRKQKLQNLNDYIKANGREKSPIEPAIGQQALSGIMMFVLFVALLILWANYIFLHHGTLIAAILLSAGIVVNSLIFFAAWKRATNISKNFRAELKTAEQTESAFKVNAFIIFLAIAVLSGMITAMSMHPRWVL